MSTCPHCDPLLFAGVHDCSRCGALSYPVDACWVGPGLLLAEYQAECAHVSAGVQVVDTTLMGPPTRCLASTAGGKRCARRPNRGQPYCSVHLHAHQDGGQ